jgi:hypothetical protein
MLRAIVGALVRSVRRDLAGYGSLKTNNFFLFVVLIIGGALASGVAPVASYPFLAALGALMIVPASGDPLEKIPAVRMGLWPVSRGLRFTLRACALLMNPAFWVLGVLIWARAGWKLAAGFVVAVIAARVFSSLRMDRRHTAIVCPTWLITNNVRQMFCVLDTYLALAIGMGGGLWRVFGHADSNAFPVLSILAALALSTHAQCLFALDGDDGMTRYRLLPIRGWRIVLAKDAAFLGVLLFAVLPLDIPRSIAFGLTALALGRYPAMRLRLGEQRWRFTSGRVLWGVLQSAAGIGTPLPIAAALYTVSLWWAGRDWDRQ